MAEFRVVIDGRLTPEQERTINTAIQAAVLPHLAGFGGDGPDEPGVFVPHRPIPHRPWWGLVAAPISEEVAAQLKLRG